LGVSLPEIDRLCSHLEERFGLSFKISGAGGGGCIISFPIRKSTSVNIEEIVSEAQKIIPNVTGYVTKPINVGLRMEE
jgi:mevalonate kinase